MKKKTTKSLYKGYFRRHYKANFDTRDIENYRKWFYSQWEFINTKIVIKPKSSILEIGSAFGGFYSFLENTNYDGIELDKDAVEFANTYFDTKHFVNKSIEDLRENKKFDIIFAFEVLEHLENPLSILEKIYRLLKKGGIFCGTSPFPFYKNIVADLTHLFILHPKNWEILFSKSGFRKIELYPMSFFPIIWRMEPRLNLRLPFYVSFFGFVSTTLIVARR